MVKNGYRVDGEIGRFYFNTHFISEKDHIYNTAKDVFPALKGKEWYRTVGYKDIAMFFGDLIQSYRKTTELINRIRYQEVKGTPYRTLQDNTEKEGARLVEFMERKTDNILKRHQFNTDGTYEGPSGLFDTLNPDIFSNRTIKTVAEKLNGGIELEEILNNPVPIENPEKSVNIAIDDVGVKRQEEKRTIGNRQPDVPSKRKYVYNTVIRIDKGQKHYTMVGSGIKATLRFLIAFLLSNKLTGLRFQFFTDGHTILNDTIVRCFKWYSNFGIILDWYHLVKKCKELLSLSMKGRLIRNEVLREIMPLLWHGLTSQAITTLEQIEDESVKDKERLTKLIRYLERNIGMIPCYSIRKVMGLRNSSAIGEKMNDLVVSSRQKHNGMSWSRMGSLAMAALTTAKLNKEKDIWLNKKQLHFKLVAA